MYESEASIAAYSVAMAFSVVGFLSIALCIVISICPVPDTSDDDKSVLDLLDKKLLPENKLNMSLDEIIRLQGLRERMKYRIDLMAA